MRVQRRYMYIISKGDISTGCTRLIHPGDTEFVTHQVWWVHLSLFQEGLEKARDVSQDLIYEGSHIKATGTVQKGDT